MSNRTINSFHHGFNKTWFLLVSDITHSNFEHSMLYGVRVRARIVWQVLAYLHVVAKSIITLTL